MTDVTFIKIYLNQEWLAVEIYHRLQYSHASANYQPLTHPSNSQSVIPITPWGNLSGIETVLQSTYQSPHTDEVQACA